MTAKRQRRKPIKYYSPKRRKVYAQGDNINALDLFELHGWICWICKKPIDRRLRVPNWGAATIEHKIPICRGGTHTWGNVVPAHYKCNLDKGDSLDEPCQGRLIL